ncbi:Tht1-like nuclear fusion protein [Rhizoctonia solani AG-3 Rhs1AP]|uniref:Tht1-like nuclear fusion protein n=1 Tax=Rhizoctonia solani AG-3 Rhs1AP TaxID=1086054 RepID=X8J7H5_9AGAM|nr:Tht1-like nuclear fusion protein [Rhizoctonia solani AG-3 Rhs1AP]
MTLCELATAEQVSLPLECKNTRTASTHRSVSQCVEALARSAQHWSSYSGYLREIPQLCTAYRRLHEIDHAKSIYANITDEKISFLSSLNGHYSELYLRQKELSGLTEGLESLVRALERYSLNLEHSVAAVPLRADELANEIRARVVALSEDILADTRALNGHAFANLENYLASMLSEVQRGFSLTTTNTQTNIEATIRSLDAVALSWNSRLVAFSQRLDVMWEETFDRKSALDQAIDDMRGRISQTDAQLELQLEATQKLQTLSSETSVSIERANFQLQSASNMLSQELETLASVTQELQTNMTRLPDLMFKFNPAWLPGILSPLSSIWSGLQFPAWQARLVMHVVGVGASGIQSSISALVTFGCALFFVMTHAFRYVSYLVGWLLPISREKRPSQSQNRPGTLVTRSTHRRGQGNRSRLTSVLPRYETI